MKQPETTPVKTQESNKKNSPNWLLLIGWGLAILFLAATLWMQKQNEELETAIKASASQNEILKGELANLENQLIESSKISNIVRSKEFQAFTLIGNQAVAPQAFAKVYLNKKEKFAYIDIKGLPAPPEGKVYQLWSLKMDPFSATNIDVLTESNRSGTEIYKIENFLSTEPLCITLEPLGGSEMPTMSQIYVLNAM